MIAGISTACFYPGTTEDALALLTERGVQSAEVFINTFSEMEPAYLNRLRKIADNGEVRILSVHPFTSGMEPMMFFSRYPRRFEDGRELYKRFYEAAGILGAKILVFHGNFSALKMEPEEYAERFGRLMEDAKREGVRLCHENVSRCCGRSYVFFQSLARLLPDAGFVLDVKQAVRSGLDVMELASAMGKNIAHIHISDHNPSNDCLPPGKGTFNIPEFLYTVRKMGFDGGAVVELYRDNFDSIEELFVGYQQLSRYISTIS